MKNYITSVLDPSNTPQSEALPNKPQVKNSAGGFVFAVNNWTRLERFLILGSEGGSYYASEHDLTKQNIDGVKAALAEDGIRFVQDSGRDQRCRPRSKERSRLVGSGSGRGRQAQGCVAVRIE